MASERCPHTESGEHVRGLSTRTCVLCGADDPVEPLPQLPIPSEGQAVPNPEAFIPAPTRQDVPTPVPMYPIPLNEAQERAVREWAADDRLWTTQDTVEVNLRTFARVILRDIKSATITWLAGGTSSLKAEVTPDLPAPRGIDLGNSSVRHVGRISIACMAPEARELLDRAMAAWAEFDAQRDPKPQDPVYAFAYWLFRWSGLIPLPTPTPAPAPREALEHAARLLAKSLPDEVLESMREEWGHTNVAVIQHWRNAVLAALRASVPNPEAAPALREALKRIAQIGRPHCQRVGEADEDDIRALCHIQEIAEAALRASEAS